MLLGDVLEIEDVAEPPVDDSAPGPLDRLLLELGEPSELMKPVVSNELDVEDVVPPTDGLLDVLDIVVC